MSQVPQDDLYAAYRLLDELTSLADLVGKGDVPYWGAWVVRRAFMEGVRHGRSDMEELQERCSLLAERVAFLETALLATSRNHHAEKAQ